ncbi:MAG: GNAT family N-acetyltransferase [Planctomycetes bacterium]|nr:GNAT family N-acetyltransferase [Planctomycetota bacterium]
MSVIRSMRADEWSTVAQLIFDSTNMWYEKHYDHPIFTCLVDELRDLFCGTYEALDPDSCLVAEVDGTIGASCFYHCRETHDSLGIMNVHPDYAGRSLGRQLLQEIISRSEARNKPLRLVSSAMNLDSFSLYNKAGFQALAIYQDMLVDVPADGLAAIADGEEHVRLAKLEDLEAIVQLELGVHGLNKHKDYEYYLHDTSGVWELLVYDHGGIQGALVSVKHPASNIVGHGIMKDAGVAAALIYRSLNRYRSMQPLVLIPADNKELIQAMYAIKARNCETHVSQVYNPVNIDRPCGIVLPTFMPENG